ncbi:hypothetical protein PG989_010600 [Apiospora arundinis]
MASLQGHELKPKVSRRLRRVKSSVPRTSGMPSLAGSVRLERSSHSVKDTLRPKPSWSSGHGSRRDDGTVAEPDEYFVAMLKNWHKNNPDNIYLDHDGIPTIHHVDNGAAFSQECVMQIEEELHEAQMKLRKAKQKVKHFGRLHIQAFKSKDFGKPPACTPDDMFEAYDRDVDAIARGPPLPIATLHQWGVMAEVELRLARWQRDVDEAEESVANLNAKMLSFALDVKPAACEKAMDCLMKVMLTDGLILR